MGIIKKLGVLGVVILLVCCKKIAADNRAKNVLVNTDSIKKIHVVRDSSAGRSFTLAPGDAVRNYGGSTGAGTKARPGPDTGL